MKLKNIGHALVSLLALGQFNTANAADATRYLVAKGQEYSQTNATALVSVISELPFRFVSTVDATAKNSVLASTLKIPNFQVRTLTNFGDGNYDFEQGYANKALLDANYTLGNYTWFILGANDSTNKPLLALPADNYPTIPKLANWAEAQELEASQPLNLAWGAFTNGTANDFIMLDISDATGASIVSTPAMLTPDALTGTNLSAQFSEGTLADGTTYEGSILFLKRTALNTTSYPGANGVTGYYRQTKFPLTTLPAPPDNGRIQFSTRNYSVPENGGPANITVTRSGTSGPVSADFTTFNGTATDGLDYAGQTTTLNFNDGETSKVIPISILDDSLAEGNETVNLALSNPQGAAILGNRSSAVLTIVDDEIVGAGKLQFAVRSNSVAEAGKFATIIVSRIGGSIGTVSATYETVDGTAIAGQNYVATNGTIVFTPGLTTKTITVPIINDSVFESNEVFQVNLTGVSGGAALGTNLTTKVGIVNDDFAGTFSFKPNTYVQSEDLTNLLVTVARSGGTASGVTVDYATADGTATDGVRYLGISGTLTFGANEVSKNILVNLVNDTLPNGDQTFFMTLTNATGGAKITNSLSFNRATITVKDDESTVYFTNANYNITENVGTLTLTAFRSGAVFKQAGVEYFTQDAGAQAGIDYVATNGVLVFQPNVTSKTITVKIVDNALVQFLRGFQVKLANPTNGLLLGALHDANITIADNDFAGTIGFAASTYSVTDAGTNAVITLVRSNGLASGIVMNFYTTDGTAVAGVDYTDGTQLVTFGAGETTKKVFVPITRKPLTDTSRTVFLSLTSTNGAFLGRSSATLNILENRTSIEIQQPSYFVNKTTDANFSITLIRRGVLTGQASVNYTTANGSATTPAHYRLTAGTAIFPAGTRTKIITIPIITNSPAGDRNFSLHLTSPIGAIYGAVTNTTITISDSGLSTSILSFNNDTFATNKTSSATRITINRTGGLGTPTTVYFDTADGTAFVADSEYPGDYFATSQIVTFPANVATQTVIVPLINNPYGGTLPIGEGTNRWFTCSLSNPQGSQLGLDATTRADILDPLLHGVVKLSAANYSASAASGSFTINLQRTGGSAGTVAVYLAMYKNGDNAFPSVDYINPAGFVTFSEGETSKNVNVPLLIDNSTAYPKRATVYLNTPFYGAGLVAPTNAVLTITP